MSYIYGSFRSCILLFAAVIFLGSSQVHAANVNEAAPACRRLECLAQFIERHIRPTMQSAYKAYYDALGSRLSDAVWSAIENYDARKKMSDEVVARYPTSAKKAYEKYVYGLFHLIKKVPIESISENLQSGFDILGHASAVISGPEENTVEQKRVRAAIDKMRPYLLDPGMRACTRGHIIDVPIENAFNTGCHIFLTRETVTLLSDDQLLAVVAHEMGHSARGDGLDNFIVLLKESAKQSGLLLLDEAHWFLTGEDYEHLKALQDGVFLDLVLRSFGVQAEKIELMADLVAVKMLRNSGRSEELLVSALIKLVAGNSATEDTTRIRQYPGLQKRIDAIRAYAARL